MKPAFFCSKNLTIDTAMNLLDSRRLVTAALVLLALFNVMLLGLLFWQNRCSIPILPGGGRFGAHQPFVKSLALSNSQALSFRQLRQQHFIKVRPQMESIARLKQQLVEESLKERPDTNKIGIIATAIGNHQVSIEHELALHFHELAKVCTPAQRDSLKQTLNQIAAHKHSLRMNRWIDQR